MTLKFVFLLVLLTGIGAQAETSVHTAPVFTFDDVVLANMAREHVFMVDPNGRFIDPPTKWGWAKKSAAFSENDSFNSISNGIKNWVAQPRTRRAGIESPPRIVVFVHGGLNSYDDTKHRLRDVTLMQSLADSNCYPVFISWDSSLLSSYRQHLWPIRQGEEHKIMAFLSSPGVFISDLAIGVARLPQTLALSYYNDYRTAELPEDSWPARLFGDKRTARWEGFESLIHSNLANYQEPIPERETRGWYERNVRLGEYILTGPTKIVTLPIIDGLGTEAWNMMIRRTRTMFDPPSGYEIQSNLTAWATETPNEKNVNSVSNWLAGMDGGMYAFAHVLKNWSVNPSNAFSCSNLTFDFCGHSMGTIVLNELFRNNPEIKAHNIVYLAAACSVLDFENSLVPYLETNGDAEFYNVSLHRMRERDEYCLASVGHVQTIPVIRDLVVRGSLLNWIDDIFEKPTTITDRTLGSWENITRALPDIPDEAWPRIHLRGCNAEKLNILWKITGTCEPQVHGDFTKAIFWSQDFYWPGGTNRLGLLTNDRERRVKTP